MNLTRTLAKSIVNARFEDLSPKTVEATKVCVLDTIGVSLAATTQGDGCRELVDLAKEAGGKPESSVLVFGGKLPAWMAAFANGAITHPLDYDDMHIGGHVHSTAACLPAALAMAERTGNMSGKDLITAVAVGSDAVCRLGMCCTKDQADIGWVTPPLLGFFGAAVSAGRYLKLNEDQMVGALGFAFHQATGSFLMAAGNSGYRGLYEAFIGKAGVLSAMMAAKGLVGGEEVLDCKYGLFQLQFGGNYVTAPLTDGLGRRSEVDNISLKPWPSCGGTSPFIDASLALLREQPLKPDDIAGITLVVDAFGQAGCEPVADRIAPKTAMAAKYSVPFCVAHALVNRKVDMASFSAAGLADAAVLKLAPRITYKRELTLEGKPVPTGAMIVKTTGGKTLVRKAAAVYGSPQNPMTEKDRIAKFKDCAAFSIKPLSAKKVDQVISTVGELEKLDSIGKLIDLLI